VSRSVKADGGTDWDTGEVLTATRLNGDINPIVNEFNGEIDNANIASDAAIEMSKLDDTTAAAIDAAAIDDYSATEAESDNSEDPGTADNTDLAENLQEEIAQLRYKIEQLTIGTSATTVTSGGGTDTDAHWVDGPFRGGNLIYHGGFDAWQQADCVAGACAAEGLWDLETATADLKDTALTEAEGFGDGMGMQITANGAGVSGLKQTLNGLKADTRYLAITGVRPTTGDSCRMFTAGADGTEMSIDSASDNAWEVISGTFETDSTPTDVVLKIVSVANGDICLFDNVGVFEIGGDPVPQGGVIIATEATTETADGLGVGMTDVPDNGGSLEATVTPSVPGCVIEVDAYITVKDDGGDEFVASCQLLENGGSASALRIAGVEEAALGDVQSVYASMAMHRVNVAPVAGTAYLYTVQCTDDIVGGAEYFCDAAAGEGTCDIYVKMTCPTR
jgi:hypothetical protein